MSFGPQFAPAEEFKRWAWNRIMPTTDLPPATIETAFAPWSEAFDSGDPRKEMQALANHLGKGPFRWAWFEECRRWVEADFKAAYGWPYLWRTPKRGTLRGPESLLKLLRGELARMTFHARDRAGAARFKLRGLGEMILVSGWGCPAEDAIARRFVDRFKLGDGTAWPPYFPGDRTSTRLEVIPGRRPSPLEIARCALSIIDPVWPVSPTMPFPRLN